MIIFSLIDLYNKVVNTIYLACSNSNLILDLKQESTQNFVFAI